MIRNQPDAALRRATLLVYQDDGATPIARNTNFAGKLLFDPGDGNYIPATGILTNKRMPLTGVDFTYTADHTTGKFHRVAHGLNYWDGPFQTSNAGGALPAGVLAATDYWVTPFGADDFKISTSLANAVAGIFVAFTDDGTGVQTWSFQPDTYQGVDGDFQYEFSLAETNQDATFVEVFVPAVAGVNDAARTIVPLESDAIGFDAISEAGHTYGDEIRGMAAILFGIVNGWTVDNPQWFGLDGVTLRIQGTTTLDGRPAIAIVKLTP